MRSNAPMGPSCSFTLLRWVHRMTWLFVNCALLFRWKGKKMYFSSIYETFCMADLETIRWMVCLWMWTFPVPFYAFLYIICKSNSEFPLFYVMDVLVIDYFRLFKLLSNLELLEVTSCYWWGHYFFPFYWRFIFSIGIRKIIFTRAANHKHHIPLHVNVSVKGYCPWCNFYTIHLIGDQIARGYDSSTASYVGWYNPTTLFRNSCR